MPHATSSEKVKTSTLTFIVFYSADKHIKYLLLSSTSSQNELWRGILTHLGQLSCQSHEGWQSGRDRVRQEAN